ncbi:MAG: hypothetical protein J3Q66DRAFT_338883 [Benniella sp.]|nr:MAG: hypothetical protein J3Q66DRAFT_338883 [Benniella sp.]
MGDDSKTRHEIHLAQHPGYDLRNHGAFFDKFGPHLLMMMYLVKYGATSAERFIPPLSDLKVDVDQGQLHFPKGDLSRLVDDMITYLEDTIRVNNNEKDPTSNWELKSSELAQLKSYLEVEEDENVLGNLCQTITRDRHSVWVCSKHQHEYHEATLRWPKELIAAKDGEYIEDQGKVTIKVKSDTLTKRLLEAMRTVYWIQGFDRQLSLELGRYGSMAMSETYILIDRDITHSLVLDFGKFTLSASILQNGTCNMEIEMDRLSGLTSDDLASILRYQHSRLTIRNTPQEADEVQLINILQHSVKLEILRIGCQAERSLAVINLIISEIFRNGSSLPLHTFELMNEGLVPVNYDVINAAGRVTAVVEFSEDKRALEMSTNVKFPALASNYGPILDFVRLFGWSIETLAASAQFSDSHALILRGAVRERGSRIETFNIVPYTISTDSLDEIITMSPGFTSLGLLLTALSSTAFLEKAMIAVRRYKDRVRNLLLSGREVESWLPPIAEVLSTRDVLPKLSVLSVEFITRCAVPEDCVKWIVAMVSTPVQPLSSSATVPPEPLTRLERLALINIELQPRDWRSVIMAIDLTSLEWLNLKKTNISQEELELLVRRIVDNFTTPVRLRTLCVDEKLLEQEDARALRAILQEKAPLVQFK